MPEDLKNRKIYVGLKQSMEAALKGMVLKAYIADDADSAVIASFKTVCRDMNIETISIESRKKLGKACGINVSAAVAVLLK